RDWSSDMCSSDLVHRGAGGNRGPSGAAGWGSMRSHHPAGPGGPFPDVASLPAAPPNALQQCITFKGRASSKVRAEIRGNPEGPQIRRLYTQTPLARGGP